MTVAIVVEAFNGQFAATLPGVPDLRAVRSTRGEAIEAVQAEIQKRLESGELVTLEIPRRGVAAFGGAFRDDPTLRDMCDEIYRQRDAEPYERSPSMQMCWSIFSRVTLSTWLALVRSPRMFRACRSL